MDDNGYVRLKNAVLKAVGDTYNLEELKNHFKEDIDSPRTYKKIRSIEELITVLEHRDVLNSQCPMALFYIGDILKNEQIITFKQMYKERYFKDTRCLCGEELDRHSSSSTLQLEGNSCFSKSDVIKTPNKDVMDAIKIVADRKVLQRHWRVLASELNVEEFIIDQIYEKYPKDESMQAYEAMKHWAEKEKENATIESLDKALNARLCKKKGFGSHLRKPLSQLSL